MNHFKCWIEQHLFTQAISKSLLVKKMGYHNVDKGLRRLHDFLDKPHLSHHDFITRLLVTLPLDRDELHQQIIARKKQIVVVRQPFIQLIYPHLNTISPLSHRGWLRKLLREKVPEIVQGLPKNQREKQLNNLYYNKLKTLDHKLAASITGFAYYES